ncbi:hypothetical protein X763_28710 [Mesorhizobium sp. LSHC432A00]|nr:hypothetical protein X763_28710 [Mesorhizobium sp. LSHC432A00]
MAPTIADISTTTGMAPTPMRSIWLKIAAGLMAWPRPSFIWAPPMVAPRMFIEARKSSRIS